MTIDGHVTRNHIVTKQINVSIPIKPLHLSKNSSQYSAEPPSSNFRQWVGMGGGGGGLRGLEPPPPIIWALWRDEFKGWQLCIAKGILVLGGAKGEV